MTSTDSATTRRKQTVDTAVQAFEAVTCTFLLIYGFALLHKPGAIWALVSAVIVLRPGFEDSLRASCVRIAANLVGAAVGVAIGSLLGGGPAPVALALCLVIAACQWEPLHEGVRSACAGTVVVMLHEPAVSHSGIERFLAVVIGCCTALVIGYLGDRIFRPLYKRCR